MEKTISKTMQRVVDALVAGEPVPAEAQAALTDAERSEVAALARTAHLTKLTLAKPEPTAEMEAAALARARDAYEQRRIGGGLHPATSAASDDTRSSPLIESLRRLLGRFRQKD
ncbi:MAG: hypothetical protein V4671_28510 [Armatimonadota bacterium]